MKTRKCILTVGILAVFAIALVVFAACDNGTSSTGGNIDVPIDVPPESLPVAERWGKWVSGDYGEDPSTATLVYSVDGNGVCTITVGGIAQPNDETDSWGRWKANAQYKYTATANTCYAYVFDAWTQSGTRELGCQYYTDNDDEVYIGSGVTLTETPETYTIKGQAIPKGGIRHIEFQCADQLGTFYVKILAIYAYTPSLEYELIDDIDSPNNGTYRVSSATGMSGAVEIPATYKDLPVTEIGENTFNGYRSLTSITIPEGVTSIGWDAFWNCTSLANITIPASVTTIDWGAFWGCNSLATVTFASGSQLKTIGDRAFMECNLTSVTIPEGVTEIGGWAFAECKNLTSITLPASVTGIYGAFEGCTNLTNITVDTNNPYYASEGGILYNKDKTELLAYPSASGNVTIPDGVTYIGPEAFYGCTSLTGITLPEGVTEIGPVAFEGCTNLTNITVDANNPYYASEGGILYNKDKTELIAYPSASGNVTIPEGVTEIGGCAFYGCRGISEITIPASVTYIGWGAFMGWTPSQTIYIRGYASQAAADAAWDEYLRYECNATIKYWNGSSYQ